MLNLKQIFLLLSILLPIYSPIPYIRSILRRQTKPHRTTRLVYLLIGLLTTISLFASGERVAVWISGVSLLQAIVLFFLGLRYGVGGWSKTDLICLIFAIIGVIAWQTTNDPVWGLYFGIGADFFGTIPTIIKTWRLPTSEEPQFYILDAAAGGFSLLALSSWTPGDFSYPLYLMLINATVAILTQKNRWPKAGNKTC